MDLHSLPEHLTAEERVRERRRRIEEKLGLDLSLLDLRSGALGSADERNCEQMFGVVPLPIGYAGPLRVTFSSGKTHDIHLPLATTEGALVASVNRGCKALTSSGGVTTTSVYHGVSRTLAFRIRNASAALPISPGACAEHSRSRLRGAGSTGQESEIRNEIASRASEWKTVGESTSNHLRILRYDFDTSGDYLFLTLYADTDEAMGMNMVTIAGDAIGKWIEEKLGLMFVAVAANVDSDKKPSIRTKTRGRGYEVEAYADVPDDVIRAVLKSTPDALLTTADAKLTHGSKLAGAIGANLHAANVIAALYLATGQDAAHVVEGSLAETSVIPGPPALSLSNGSEDNAGVRIRTRLPALLIGTRGGGTDLPAERQCLNLLLHPRGTRTPLRKDSDPLHPCRQLAEAIGAAVLGGELSLLAALSSHHLARAHATIARGRIE